MKNFISTDIAQLAYYIIADAKWTNRSINGSSSVRFSVIISTNDLYVAVEARSPTWPVGSISVVAQCSIHGTAQRCIFIIFCLVKIDRPLNYMPSELDFSSNKPMFSASFKESGFKKNVKLLYATFENMNFTIWAFNYATQYPTFAFFLQKYEKSESCL